MERYEIFMEKDKSGIYDFFDDIKRTYWDDIEIGKIEENSACIYVEFNARVFEYSIKDRRLTIANRDTRDVLLVDENYDVEIFYDE